MAAVTAMSSSLSDETSKGDKLVRSRGMGHADEADDFHFDSISQVRIPTWTHDRVALIDDAASPPGPAVGGGASLAGLSTYVPSQELTHSGSGRVPGPRGQRPRHRDREPQGRAVGDEAADSGHRPRCVADAPHAAARGPTPAKLPSVALLPVGQRCHARRPRIHRPAEGRFAPRGLAPCATWVNRRTRVPLPSHSTKTCR